MFSLRIDGFQNEAQARAFIEWYEGSGEQAAGDWFSCRMEEGEIDVDFMPVNCHVPYRVEGSTLIAELRLHNDWEK